MRVASCAFLWIVLASPTFGDTVLWSINGTQSSGKTGAAVAIAGDVDGDGHADFVVSQPNYGVAPSIQERGAVRMYSGLDGHVLWTSVGSTPFEHRGTVTIAGADATGDGIPDVATSAPGYVYVDVFARVHHGAVFVLDGATGAEAWWTVNPVTTTTTAFGAALSFVPDADQNGRAEIAIGDPLGFGEAPASPVEAGTASVFSLTNPFPLLTAFGQTASDHLGAALAAMPDTDGDGMPELAVGVPDRDTALPTPPWSIDDTGQIRVYAIASFPPSTLVRSIGGGLTQGGRLGAVLASGGDCDGDGVLDLLAGTPDAGNGVLRVYSGASYGAVRTLSGLASGDRFSAAVANAGDVNGDGFADIVVGAPNAADVPQALVFNRGRVSVISGKDLAAMSSRVGVGSNAHFGAAVGGGRDVDLDGRPDVIAGAPDQSSMGVALVLGVLDHPASWSLTGDGTVGSHGVPGIALSAPPETCQGLTLSLGNSTAHSTPTTLFLSTGFQPLATGLGGTLYPQLPALQSGIVLPAGGLAIPTSLPCDASLWGVTVYLQQLVADSGAPHQVAFSRCLVATIGGF